MLDLEELDTMWTQQQALANLAQKDAKIESLVPRVAGHVGVSLQTIF